MRRPAIDRPLIDRQPIDRRADPHTHSWISDGIASPQRMAEAAQARGLATWGLSDHVRAGTTWLAEYEQVVRGLHLDGLEIECGVEAKMLDDRGRLDLPARLPKLDYVLIADHQLPTPDGPMPPEQVRQHLGTGRWTGVDVVEQLVTALCAAASGAILPAIVAHPFSLLITCGVSDKLIDDEVLDAFAKACVSADVRVEINEKWRCPSPAVVVGLYARGVDLCRGSDAHRAEDVGAWTYADDIGFDQ
jgi:putative hydrolase